MSDINVDLGGNLEDKLNEIWSLTWRASNALTRMSQVAKVALNPDGKNLDKTRKRLQEFYKDVERVGEIDKAPLLDLDLSQLEKAKKQISQIRALIHSGAEEGQRGAGRNIDGYQSKLGNVRKNLDDAAELAYGGNSQLGVKILQDTLKQISSIFSSAKHDDRVVKKGSEKEEPKRVPSRISKDDTEQENLGSAIQDATEKAVSSFREIFDDIGEDFAKKIEDAAESAKQDTEVQRRSETEAAPLDVTAVAPKSRTAVGNFDTAPASDAVDINEMLGPQFEILGSVAEDDAKNIGLLSSVLDELHYSVPRVTHSFRTMMDDFFGTILDPKGLFDSIKEKREAKDDDRRYRETGLSLDVIEDEDIMDDVLPEVKSKIKEAVLDEDIGDENIMEDIFVAVKDAILDEDIGDENVMEDVYVAAGNRLKDAILDEEVGDENVMDDVFVAAKEKLRNAVLDDSVEDENVLDELMAIAKDKMGAAMGNAKLDSTADNESVSGDIILDVSKLPHFDGGGITGFGNDDFLATLSSGEAVLNPSQIENLKEILEAFKDFNEGLSQLGETPEVSGILDKLNASNYQTGRDSLMNGLLGDKGNGSLEKEYGYAEKSDSSSVRMDADFEKALRGDLSSVEEDVTSASESVKKTVEETVESVKEKILSSKQDFDSLASAINEAFSNPNRLGNSSPRGSLQLNGQKMANEYLSDPAMRNAFLYMAKPGNSNYGRNVLLGEQKLEFAKYKQEYREGRDALRNTGMGDKDSKGGSNLLMNLLSNGLNKMTGGDGGVIKDSIKEALSSIGIEKAFNEYALTTKETWGTDTVWDDDSFKNMIEQTEAFGKLLEEVNSQLKEGESELSKDDLFKKLKDKEISRGRFTGKLGNGDIESLAGGVGNKRRLIKGLLGNSESRTSVLGGMAKNSEALRGMAGFAKAAGPIGVAAVGVVKLAEGAKKLAEESVKAYEGVQSLQTQLGVVFGSKSSSQSTFNEIESYAKKSPFGVEQMTQAAIQLKQSGVYSSQLMDTLKSIGDISSGNAEKFKSISDVYARVMSSTTVTARDMRQLSNAGVASYSALSKATGIDRSQIRSQLQAGKVSSQDFQKMVEQLTAKGGMFYGATEKGASTLAARKQNLSDSKQMALSEIGRYLTSFGSNGGKDSWYTKMLSNVESILQFIEEGAKKRNDEKDIKRAEKSVGTYEDYLRDAEKAFENGNYKEYEKLTKKAEELRNSDVSSKGYEAELSRRNEALEKEKELLRKLEDGNFQSDTATSKSDFARFQMFRDQLFNASLSDGGQTDARIEKFGQELGMSLADIARNFDEIAGQYFDQRAAEMAGIDSSQIDYIKSMMYNNDGSLDDGDSYETFLGNQLAEVRNELERYNTVGFAHDFAQLADVGYAWIDHASTVVDSWADITSTAASDLEASMTRMSAAKTDWMNSSPLAQMMNADEKARRDEVLKERVTTLADKSWDEEKQDYNFGKLDIEELFDAESLFTTAEKLSIEWDDVWDRYAENGAGALNDVGEETYATIRDNLTEYYEALSASDPTEFLDQDTLEKINSLMEKLGGNLKEMSETDVTSVNELFSTIGKTLTDAAASDPANKKLQAAAKGFEATGTRMEKDPSNAKYLNKRKQADLWAQIISQTTGVDASRVQLSGAKSVMNAYTQNFARRDMFSSLGKSLMQNGASLKELSNVLKENKTGTDGYGHGTYNWTAASDDVERMAASRSVETQNALISAYQQQIDTLSELEMSGIATRDTWDNLNSLSAQLGTGFTLAAEELADGTYRFTEATIEAAEKMKRELDMKKVVQQIDSIFRTAKYSLDQETMQSRTSSYLFGDASPLRSMSSAQKSKASELVTSVFDVFAKSDAETLDRIARQTVITDREQNIIKDLLGDQNLDLSRGMTTKTVVKGGREFISSGGTTTVNRTDDSWGTLLAYLNGASLTEDQKNSLENNYSIPNPRSFKADYLDENFARKYFEGVSGTFRYQESVENFFKAQSNTGLAMTISQLEDSLNSDGKKELKKLSEKFKKENKKELANAKEAVDYWLDNYTAEVVESLIGKYDSAKGTSHSGATLSKGTNGKYDKISSTETVTVPNGEWITTADREESVTVGGEGLAEAIKELQSLYKDGFFNNANDETMGKLYSLLSVIDSDFNHKMSDVMKSVDANTDALVKLSAAQEASRLSDQITDYRRMWGMDTKAQQELMAGRAFGDMEEWAPQRMHVNTPWNQDALEWLGLPTDLDFGAVLGRIGDQFNPYEQNKEIDELVIDIKRLAAELAALNGKSDLTDEESRKKEELEGTINEYQNRVDLLGSSTENGSQMIGNYLTSSAGRSRYNPALGKGTDEQKDKLKALMGAPGTDGSITDALGNVDTDKLEEAVNLMREMGMLTGDVAAAWTAVTENAVKNVAADERAAMAMKKYGEAMESSLRNAAFDGYLQTTKLIGENMYKVENSLMTQEEAAESVKKSLASQAAAMLDNISNAAVQAGLGLVYSGAMDRNFGMIAAGLGLAAAGGFGSIASGLLSGYANDSSKDDMESKMQRLESLKNNLADLLKQARDDAEYYEVNLRNKKAISTNESVSSSGFSVTKTNDMILTPSGAFSTAPDDYIFAMKDPASLTRGSGGGTVVNFSIVNQSGEQLGVSSSTKKEDEYGNIDLEVVVNGIVQKSMMDGDYDGTFAAVNAKAQGRSTFA